MICHHYHFAQIHNTLVSTLPFPPPSQCLYDMKYHLIINRLPKISKIKNQKPKILSLSLSLMVMESLTGVNANIVASHHHIHQLNFKPNLASRSVLFCAKSAINTNYMKCYSNSCYPISISHSSSIQVTHCFPLSESEEALGSESAGISKSVCVKFQLEKECQFGDHFFMVGDDPILGSWNPSDAVPFNWSEGHIWALVLELPVDKSIKYKFLLKKSTGEILWQPGPDRFFQSWETKKVIVVGEEWENAEAQKISEEQQITDEDEELIAGTLVDPSVIGLPGEHLEGSSLPVVTTNIKISGSDENANADDHTVTANENSSSASVNEKSISSDRSSQKELPSENSEKGVRVDQSSVEAEDEGSFIIDDEGVVLVPGLTLPFMTSDEAQ